MSQPVLFPGKLTACQAGIQPPGGVSGTSDPIRYPGRKFCHIMRSKIRAVFTHLGPNEFDRVEFWCTGRKMIDMQTRMLINEILNQLAFMDGMVIPHQDDFTWDLPQQLLQKGNHLLAAQAAPIRADYQFDLAATRTDQQGTQQIQPLVMLQAGAEGRCSATPRPTAFERRDQREAAFIFKYQRGSQLTPLFLSLARPSVSRKQSLSRRAGSPGAALFGCSSPSGPLRARHRWEHSGSGTTPRSHARSAPASSNLRHIHGHRPHAIIPAPNAGAVPSSIDWAALAVVRSFSAGCLAVPASDRHCVR